MKRSTFVTWDQLKVGVLILLAMAILSVAIFKLGQAAQLFTKRYELVAFLPNANGLREGGSVTVAGQLAGVVERIEFLPPDGDTTRNLRITIAINQQLQPQIREDSRAKLRTLGLLGDKVFDITPGTPRFAVLPAGDTITVAESLDYEQVIAQASGAVGDMVVLAHDLRELTGGIVRGEGTMGQLLTSRSLFDQLNSTLRQTSGLLARLQKPDGTFGRLVDDPTLYNRLVSTTTSVDSLLQQLNSRQGTAGRLLSDTLLYTRMVGVTADADSVLKMLTKGNGFAARLLNDQQMYDKLNKSITSLNAILEDVRRDPRKYTKGIFSIF